ncbi:hypothetical protein ALHIDCOG_00259 [Klebsiella phage CPRSB]|nr:hypothetical protein ALHIDCOG_00259 [Klebsiella phage CPRSB]
MMLSIVICVQTGCTGFVEPLQLAVEVATDLQADNGNLNSLIFLTDGYDNCWRTDDILKACSTLPLTFNNIAFLEYGYYVNRPLLENNGGSNQRITQIR